MKAFSASIRLYPDQLSLVNIGENLLLRGKITEQFGVVFLFLERQVLVVLPLYGSRVPL